MSKPILPVAQKKTKTILNAAFHQPGTRSYRITEWIIWTLIIVSCVFMILDTFIWKARPTWYPYLDNSILGLFAIELILRTLTYKSQTVDVFAGTQLWRVRTHILDRILFLFSPLQLLDLLVILTFLPQLRGLRLLRLLRLARGIRLFQYSDPLKGIFRTFQENSLLYVFTFSFLGIVVVLGGVSFFLVEVRSNPQVNTVSDGIWWALVTVTTVGYGDITPATIPLGRIIAGVVMILGMFTLALFAGIVSSTLLRVLISLRGDQFRMSNYTNHIVVLGYDHGCQLLLGALLQETDSSENELVVFAPGERPPELPAEFIWVNGNPSKESELDKIRLTHAKTAIVVASRQMEPSQTDATTIMNIFTLRSYMASRATKGEQRKQPLYVVAEILDPENVAHATTAGANEVIETTRLGFSLMAHAALVPGSGTIMAKVASAGAHSLYISENPACNEVTFGQLTDHLHNTFDVILLGVRNPVSAKVTLDPADDFLIPTNSEVVYLAKAPVLIGKTFTL